MCVKRQGLATLHLFLKPTRPPQAFYELQVIVVALYYDEA